MIILGLDTRPDLCHYRPEAPAPRQQAAYRCARGHGFEVTFAARAELPQAWECRCGAAGQLGGQEAPTAPADAGEHERHMIQLRGRRTLPELEQLLGDRLAELAAMRKAGKL